MPPSPATVVKSCTAFAGHSRLAAGPLDQVARQVKAALDRGEERTILIFDDATSFQIELDLRGTVDDVVARMAQCAAPIDGERAERKVGRPKLGVVGREVTLLPRHWDWLTEQPGGASVALRRLIDAERKSSSFKELARKAQETTYRFMSALAGNLDGFEDASRALFASDRDTFTRATEAWPDGVRDHARWLMTGGTGGDGH
jgi:uncharacterized protein